MLLKTGQRIFLSELGHKGFLYPSKIKAYVVSPTIVSFLPWNKFGSFKPVLIDTDCISEIFSVERIAVWVSFE